MDVFAAACDLSNIRNALTLYTYTFGKVIIVETEGLNLILAM